MIRDVLKACVLIVTETVRERLQRFHDADLIDVTRDLHRRIDELENDLDAAYQENHRLREQLKVTHSDAMPNPYDPYNDNECMSCGEQAGPYWCPTCKAT